jgi:tetratricopeptide (TPR) repeat protein
MSFLSRLFGSRPESRKGPEHIDAELARLERDAEKAAPGYVGTAYNKAGDLALRGGRADRALEYYGRAIDAFLDDAQREAARGVANKIIRVRPSAVRTLCTLTWLDLAAKHQATALLHLRDYVESAKQVDQQVRAATQIYAMARLSSDTEFIAAVADALDGLDFTARAREVRTWAANGAPGAVSDHELAHACLRGAVNSSARDAEMLRDEDAPPEEGEERGDSAARPASGADEHEVSAGDEVPSGSAAAEVPSATIDADAGEDSATPPAASGGRNGAKNSEKGRKAKNSKRYRWD